jgi:glycine/D-amino acid oxidase-like deaminating enzyme/nitrite reductase/ring-hydroxylating ferredoxin subunit
MQRDGFNTSLWQSNVPEYTPVNSFKNITYDVVIAGGGITGIGTALQLQKAGKQCLLLEGHSLGFGTTSGTTAHLNTVLDTPYPTIIKNFGEDNARLVAQAAKQAIAQVEMNIQSYCFNCGFSKVDGYMFAENADQDKQLEDIVEGTQKSNVAIEYTNSIPVPMSFTKAVKFSGQAKFHPTHYIVALAKAFEEAGGIILLNCMVKEITDELPIVISTTQGEIYGNQFIWATHTPPGVNLLSFRLAPYRSYAIAVELTDKAQEFEGLVYDCNDPYYYYRMQKVNGKNYLIAGGEDHKTGHEENTDKCFLNLEAHVHKYFSFDQVAYKWSSQYYEPTDGLPYIGHMPGGSENIFVATGFGGNGMIYSTVAAFVLKDLLLTGESPYKFLFNPNRVKPIAGFTNFVKENFDVVKEFITGLFDREKLESLADLAHGEAKVVSYEGKKMGIYKDEQGELHAVNTTCTHAKCSVAWNTSEKSWDCPCHGARYSCDGKVITGPATDELKPIDIAQAAEA